MILRLQRSINTLPACIPMGECNRDAACFPFLQYFGLMLYRKIISFFNPAAERKTCKLLMRNFMRVAYTAEGEGQHFPVGSLLFIHFGNREFRYCIVAPDHSGKSNAVPDNGNIA